MSHPHIAQRASSVLVVVDMQEPFLQHMTDRETLVKNIITLLHIAKIVGTPVLVTEQYPEKLGPTTPELREPLEKLGLYEPIAKMAFSCCGADDFVEAIGKARRDTLIVTGMEAHVCIQQTSLDALNLGLKVHLIADAVTSRRREDLSTAIEKLRHAGAVISTAEMVAYELLERAGTPEFKRAMEYLKW